MARFRWSPQLVLVSLFLIAFSGTARAADTAVEMRDKRFEPAEITVAVGATVTWTNYDGDGVDAMYRHNAVARDDSWRTPLLQTDESATLTFDAVATYEYICSLHTGMIGRINVVDAAPPATDMVARAPTDESLPGFMLVAGLAAGVAAFALAGRRQRMMRR